LDLAPITASIAAPRAARVGVSTTTTIREPRTDSVPTLHRVQDEFLRVVLHAVLTKLELGLLVLTRVIALSQEIMSIGSIVYIETI
jgi:hypothetical protein